METLRVARSAPGAVKPSSGNGWMNRVIAANNADSIIASSGSDQALGQGKGSRPVHQTPRFGSDFFDQGAELRMFQFANCWFIVGNGSFKLSSSRVSAS